MPLFDFTFKNLEKTLESNHLLGWFYLTNGAYNICINGKRLLSYNPDIWTADAKIVAEQYDNGFSPEIPDYYVARLHEYVLSFALPYAWQNVSDLIHACLLNPKVYDLARAQWAEKLQRHDQAMRYALFGGSFGYMGMPVFRLWRYADEIYLYWNGNETDGEGVPYFQHRGEAVFVMAEADFIREVEDFHQRLMTVMAERIYEVQTRYPDAYRQMKVDNQTIWDRHQYYQSSLNRAMRHQRLFPTDFEQKNLAAGIDLRKMLAENDYPIEIIRVNHF
ncbi:DUF5984 family protein [Conchiformibius kuhniae]|uniref:DUF5984 family protein n=1 Tax=Conchiformibius kuhniae TaxID=211502 RepID=A0A8T9MW97_9NEIS|nr:DUF5984 family protein [Conchiformibius kuhniae]UOP04736.1 DUF5984 family protein [Conchiformibius kuhniae]